MKNQVLISGAVIVRPQKKGNKWFIVKNPTDGSWELPKIIVRKTESSVRAALRMIGEQGGLRVRVLEEAGRYNATVNNSGRVISQRYLYYLMLHRADSGESIGFEEPTWMEYGVAAKKLASKKERKILRGAKDEYRQWLKNRKKRPLPAEQAE